MRRFSKDYGSIKAMQVDSQLVMVCQKNKAAVNVDAAIAQFRWCIENNRMDSDDYFIIRGFLEGLLTKNTVNDLEVSYEKFSGVAG